MAHGAAGASTLPPDDAAVSFATDASPADLIAFYRTELSAAGYRVLSETQQNDSSVTSQLTFDDASSTRDDAEIGVSVTSSEELPDVSVRIDFDELAGPPHLDVFRGWTSDLPLIEGGDVEVASLSAFTVLEPLMLLRTGYELGNIDPMTAQATFGRELPTSSGWDLDPAAAIEAAEDGLGSEGTIYVAHELLDTADVSFEDSIIDPGGTLVYVDATVDLPS